MSLLEELFGGDEAEEAEALERVIEGGIDDYEERENGDDEAEEERRVVDPTKPKSVRVVKHPRLVLNAAKLTGPRGMQTLPEHFKGFKFKGKGHEKEDLDMVLKKLEHWAHRLYPKFQFADSLKKIETLGNKRPVQVTLRKIRSDQVLSSDVVTQRDSSDEEAPAPQQEDDEFDKLLQQQIELARATPHTPGGLRTPSLVPKATSSPSISEEQKQRMLRNRQLAEERKRRKNAPDTSIVDLTGFKQQVPTSVGRNEQVDLTDCEQSADIGTKTTEEVDLTGLNDASSGNPNIDENVIDMTNDTTKTGEEGEVTKPKIKTRKNVIFDSSDDEGVGQSGQQNDKHVNRPGTNGDTEANRNLSSDDKDPVSLHYSDSSDDENVPTNVSVTADVHKGMSSQTASDQPEQGNRQNGRPCEEGTGISQETIQVNADTVHKDTHTSQEVNKVNADTAHKDTDTSQEVIKVNADAVHKDTRTSQEAVKVNADTVHKDTHTSQEVIQINADTVHKDTHTSQEVIQVNADTVHKDSHTSQEFVQVNADTLQKDTHTSQKVIQEHAEEESDLVTDDLAKTDEIATQPNHSTMDIDSIMKEIEHCDEESTVTDANFDDDW